MHTHSTHAHTHVDRLTYRETDIHIRAHIHTHTHIYTHGDTSHVTHTSDRLRLSLAAV